MLKITTIPLDGQTHVLKLEGRLMAAWLGELQTARRSLSGTLQLDLSGLTFADSAGSAALRELVRTGAVITNISPFVSELLKENQV